MKKGVEMVIAHIPRNRQYIHDLLVANGVAAKQICTAGITPQPAPGCCMVFDLLNTGLHFLEEQLLEVAVGFGACKVGSQPQTSARVACKSETSTMWRICPAFRLVGL